MTAGSRQPQVRLGTIGPAVFVPLGAPGDIIGFLSVARPTGREPFTTHDVEVLQQFATQASVVIEQGRTREDLHRLSLLEDQERIARDLHDTVIQRLFATGLSLQGVTRLIREEEARRRIEDAVEELDLAVRHIRTVIFDVEATQLGGRVPAPRCPRCHARGGAAVDVPAAGRVRRPSRHRSRGPGRRRSARDAPRGALECRAPAQPRAGARRGRSPSGGNVIARHGRRSGTLRREDTRAAAGSPTCGPERSGISGHCTVEAARPHGTVLEW